MEEEEKRLEQDRVRAEEEKLRREEKFQEQIFHIDSQGNLTNINEPPNIEERQSEHLPDQNSQNVVNEKGEKSKSTSKNTNEETSKSKTAKETKNTTSQTVKEEGKNTTKAKSNNNTKSKNTNNTEPRNEEQETDPYQNLTEIDKKKWKKRMANYKRLGSREAAMTKETLRLFPVQQRMRTPPDGNWLVCPHFWSTVLQILQNTDICSKI